MSSGTDRHMSWNECGSGFGGALVDGCGSGRYGSGRGMAGGRRSSVAVSGEKCVHCGACTSICASGALSMDAPAWTLEFHPGRCNACRRCIRSCPVGAISADGSND